MKCQIILQFYCVVLSYIVIINTVILSSINNAVVQELCDLLMLYNTVFHIMLVIILILYQVFVKPHVR